MVLPSGGSRVSPAVPLAPPQRWPPISHPLFLFPGNCRNFPDGFRWHPLFCQSMSLIPPMALVLCLMVQNLAGSWAGCGMLCLKSLAWKLCLVCAFAVPFFIPLVPGTAAFSLYLGKSCLLEMDLFLKSFVFSFLEFPSPSPEVLPHFTCTALPLFSYNYVCTPLCP